MKLICVNFICGSFNDDVSSTKYTTASDDEIINK
jgi:hypothetical protein